MSQIKDHVTARFGASSCYPNANEVWLFVSPSSCVGTLNMIERNAFVLKWSIELFPFLMCLNSPTILPSFSFGYTLE